MTTITFGGGPSLNQRRDFAGLPDGTHVPGYRGYCPQIKYRVGKTYGKDTHLLAQKTIHVQPQDPIEPRPRIANVNPLPSSTGDNKYTEQMVPGYTGYIPRMPFKFGNTYKEDCDWCIDQFSSTKNNHMDKTQSLKHTVKGFPKLQPISRDPAVRDNLRTYRDTHPLQPTLIEDKRGQTEAPIPGYQGFVPRIYTTELGLGCRYHNMTKNGLESFYDETAQHKAWKSQPININNSPSIANPQSMYSRRLYLNDGMIPKYTGYVPQRRFNFGNTYGDTTRTMEVCGHKDTCFGEHQNKKGPMTHQSI
ncbi:unnamed protein product [Owenia fusiformis]|uniref:Protein FAM166B n=1 Tax=Owenia fusiformis TaxID=6347 RepID=A0A8S4NP83_OWEFU|nr:unnamed protein product [Owenia fusiformis]